MNDYKNSDMNNYLEFFFKLPDGCVFLSKLELSISRACGVNEVLLFLFLDVSTPIKSDNGLSPILNRLETVKNLFEYH